jgi:UPF0755 protein
MIQKIKKLLNSIAGKIILSVFALTFVFLLWIMFMPNFRAAEDKENLYIYPGTDYSQLIDTLEKSDFISSVLTFRAASFVAGYGSKVRSGRYIIKNGMNNFSLLRKLRSGRQDAVKVKINNIRTKEQLAGRLSEYLMPDSAEILNLLNDSAFLSQFELDTNVAVSLFIPNTYEIFWDTDATGIFTRMQKEFDKFWTKERRAKADEIPLSLYEVITLASIIEEETNNKKEHPIIAGLYINRLKTGMPLQACPTIRFALNDFTIKRVLFKHIRYASPFNTYKNTGLPPGPIRLPSIQCIDAVLNYEKHDYLFMCASELLNGQHNFAVTGEEHMVNARNYQKALDARGIK